MKKVLKQILDALFILIETMNKLVEEVGTLNENKTKQKKGVPFEEISFEVNREKIAEALETPEAEAEKEKKRFTGKIIAQRHGETLTENQWREIFGIANAAGKTYNEFVSEFFKFEINDSLTLTTEAAAFLISLNTMSNQIEDLPFNPGKFSPEYLSAPDMPAGSYGAALKTAQEKLSEAHRSTNAKIRFLATDLGKKFAQLEYQDAELKTFLLDNFATEIPGDAAANASAMAINLLNELKQLRRNAKELKPFAEKWKESHFDLNDIKLFLAESAFEDNHEKAAPVVAQLLTELKDRRSRDFATGETEEIHAQNSKLAAFIFNDCLPDIQNLPGVEAGAPVENAVEIAIKLINKLRFRPTRLYFAVELQKFLNLAKAEADSKNTHVSIYLAPVPNGGDGVSYGFQFGNLKGTPGAIELFQLAPLHGFNREHFTEAIPEKTENHPYAEIVKLSALEIGNTFAVLSVNCESGIGIYQVTAVEGETHFARFIGNDGDEELINDPVQAFAPANVFDVVLIANWIDDKPEPARDLETGKFIASEPEAPQTLKEKFDPNFVYECDSCLKTLVSCEHYRLEDVRFDHAPDITGYLDDSFGITKRRRAVVEALKGGALTFEQLENRIDETIVITASLLQGALEHLTANVFEGWQVRYNHFEENNKIIMNYSVEKVGSAKETETETKPEMPQRPGRIQQLQNWRAKCDVCKFEIVRPTYQEASIAFSQHLEKEHSGSIEINGAAKKTGKSALAFELNTMRAEGEAETVQGILPKAEEKSGAFADWQESETTETTENGE